MRRDQYGHWQDKECKHLKHKLMAIEDHSLGTSGSGRVRLADFYSSAINDGNWQFRKTKEYLSQLGSLDANDPNIPRVIIPNYMNSPSNCVAGSKYYSVCCTWSTNFKCPRWHRHRSWSLFHLFHRRQCRPVAPYVPSWLIGFTRLLGTMVGACPFMDACSRSGCTMPIRESALTLIWQAQLSPKESEGTLQSKG